MSKIVTDDIERTGEYCQFIEKLNEFHRSKGTTLLSEPVLGGKKIDLHKLYNVVIAAGGFNEVTKKRSWKQIGNGFDFPATCTNSAYILKGVYIRNL
ncbi:ARID DNA-binding domain-containing protein [Mycotypha africana]|uniref:ARID DNA-binding domain-containing protein n=1 Tax=Mycotypha africana TaxID=64632 RepID=UPI002301446A|nr:ARID DNA-binding domain-containing protein [Mycotypha africana]KAI8984217.1 ARID DNA-binding domain-containing protein [Mycotypha africana]